MKKLFPCLSALTLCLMVSPAFAMKRDNDKDEKAGVILKSVIQDFWTYDDVATQIFSFVGKNFETFKDLAHVSKQWNVIANKMIMKDKTFHSMFTDDFVKKHAFEIFDLDLSRNKRITDEGVKGLTSLTLLNLDGNDTITWRGVSNLKNLTNRKELQVNLGTKLIKGYENIVPFIGSPTLSPNTFEIQRFFNAISSIYLYYEDCPNIMGYKEQKVYKTLRNNFDAALSEFHTHIHEKNRRERNFPRWSRGGDGALEKVIAESRESYFVFFEKGKTADVYSKPQHYFNSILSLSAYLNNIFYRMEETDCHNYLMAHYRLNDSLQNLDHIILEQKLD